MSKHNKKKSGKTSKKRSLNVVSKQMKLPPMMIEATKSKFLGEDIKFGDIPDKYTVADAKVTKNWSNLKFLEDNRDKDDAAIKRLAESIKQFGQLQPIIINEKGEIIDGQTRVDACKLLGFPVLYVTSKGATIKEVILMNNIQRGWLNRDYLKCFCHSNHKNHLEYRKIRDFLDAYGLNHSVSINLLAGNFAYQGGPASAAFKTGKFQIKDLRKAEKYASQLKKLKAKVPNLVLIGKFCMAWVRVQNMISPSSEGSWNIITAVKQMEKNSDKFMACNNQDSWDVGVLDAYNKGLNKKNKIKITKDIG